MEKPGVTTLVIAALAWAGWMTSAAAADDPPKTLRGADVAVEDKAPAEKPLLGKRPGRQDLVARSFEEQPPLIPHAMQNYDEITLEDNQCLSCHDEANFRKKEAPMVSESHFEAKTGDSPATLDNARWFCTQCHVPQHDALPLVGNDFAPSRPATGSGK